MDFRYESGREVLEELNMDLYETLKFTDPMDPDYFATSIDNIEPTVLIQTPEHMTDLDVMSPYYESITESEEPHIRENEFNSLYFPSESYIVIPSVRPKDSPLPPFGSISPSYTPSQSTSLEVKTSYYVSTTEFQDSQIRENQFSPLYSQSDIYSVTPSVRFEDSPLPSFGSSYSLSYAPSDSMSLEVNSLSNCSTPEFKDLQIHVTQYSPLHSQSEPSQNYSLSNTTFHSTSLEDTSHSYGSSIDFEDPQKQENQCSSIFSLSEPVKSCLQIPSFISKTEFEDPQTPENHCSSLYSQSKFLSRPSVPKKDTFSNSSVKYDHGLTKGSIYMERSSKNTTDIDSDVVSSEQSDDEKLKYKKERSKKRSQKYRISVKEKNKQMEDECHNLQEKNTLLHAKSNKIKQQVEKLQNFFRNNYAVNMQSSSYLGLNMDLRTVPSNINAVQVH